MAQTRQMGFELPGRGGQPRVLRAPAGVRVNRALALRASRGPVRVAGGYVRYVQQRALEEDK
jgi:hypothetical protein